MNASEPKAKSKDNKKKCHTYKIRQSFKTLSTTHEGIRYQQHRRCTQYHTPKLLRQLCELDDKEMKNIEISAVGAGLGSGFDHTGKLKVMKFKEVMNGLVGN